MMGWINTWSSIVGDEGCIGPSVFKIEKLYKHIMRHKFV